MKSLLYSPVFNQADNCQVNKEPERLLKVIY